MNFETNPVNLYPWGSGQELDTVRERASNTLGCHEDEIALTPSTTVSLNMVGEGLVSTGTLKIGDNILTTDQEHGGGLAVWLHWQKFGIVHDIDKVPVPGSDATESEIVSLFSTALLESGKTYRVVSISHVLTTTGLRMPIEKIATLCKQAGALLVVDGAQAVGGISVNLTETGADVYTVSAHKWLLAPTGSGLLYVRKSSQALIAPTYLDGGYSGYTQSSGTVPLQTIAGLGYALDFVAKFGGLDSIEVYNMALRDQTYSAIQELSLQYPGLVLNSPPSATGLASPIVSMNLPSELLTNSDAVDRLFSEYGVVVKLLPDNEGGNPFVVNAIRVSHHFFNDNVDILKFVNGLSALLGNVTKTER
jgi:selenocysteine lyase/cysteine desulfurase